MNSYNSKIEECKRLWKIIFGDSDDFIELFIKDFYNEENMLCIEKENKIKSMLHLIPFDLNGLKVAYIYAVATDTDSRGLGYAKSLILQAIEKAKRDGCKAILTLPADKSLSNFYSQFGFKGRYTVRFNTKNNFDFGTGEIENDFVMMLALDNDFSLTTESEIKLKPL